MIFVTGGAGYIGSHTCVELLESGQDVTVFDNFCNASEESLARVEKITGRTVRLVQGDIRDRTA
uniref:SDR family NAD(P)-dependent oxidoreductase n=1 Tax=Hydrogenophaga sp. TaxID=1904254 RepID=UPI003565F1CA